MFNKKHEIFYGIFMMQFVFDIWLRYSFTDIVSFQHFIQFFKFFFIINQICLQSCGSEHFSQYSSGNKRGFNKKLFMLEISFYKNTILILSGQLTKSKQDQSES